MNKQDTMNLEDIRAMLRDAPSVDALSLDDILAEAHQTLGDTPAREQTAVLSRADASDKPHEQTVRLAHATAPLPSSAGGRDTSHTSSVPPAGGDAAQGTDSKVAVHADTVAAAVQQSLNNPPPSPPSPLSIDAASGVEQEDDTASSVDREEHDFTDTSEAYTSSVGDPHVLSRQYGRRSLWLRIRAVPVFVLALLSLYLCLLPILNMPFAYFNLSLTLPMPEILDVQANPGNVICVLIAAQLLCMFLSAGTFSTGIYNLFCGKPDRFTLIAIASLAGLLYATSLLLQGAPVGTNVPYLPLNMLLIYVAMRELANRAAGTSRALKAAGATDLPLALYAHADETDDVYRAIKGEPHNDNDFTATLMENTFDQRTGADRYAPIALALSVTLAVVVAVRAGTPVAFLRAFALLTLLSCPFSMAAGTGLAWNRVSRRLLGVGAALAGVEQAGMLRDTTQVVLDDSDLFPSADAVTLEALQNMGSLPDDKVLACAAALTQGAGLSLGELLTQTVKERYGVTLHASRVQSIEGGITGEIGSARCILGTPALMVKMGLQVREAPAGSIHIYLLVGNVLAGMLSLGYHTTRETYYAMRRMRKMNMQALLVTDDFNLSPAMIENEFDLRGDFSGQATAAELERLYHIDYTCDDVPCAILTEQGADSIIEVLDCAGRLAGAVNAHTLVSIVSSAVGMILAYILLTLGHTTLLSVGAVLVFLVVWYLPCWVLTLPTR